MFELRWSRPAETTTQPDRLEYRYVQPTVDASGALCPGDWTEWREVPVHVRAAVSHNATFDLGRAPGVMGGAS